jgi:hypothetical protein
LKTPSQGYNDTAYGHRTFLAFVLLRGTGCARTLLVGIVVIDIVLALKRQMYVASSERSLIAKIFSF